MVECVFIAGIFVVERCSSCSILCVTWPETARTHALLRLSLSRPSQYTLCMSSLSGIRKRLLFHTCAPVRRRSRASAVLYMNMVVCAFPRSVLCPLMIFLCDHQRHHCSAALLFLILRSYGDISAYRHQSSSLSTIQPLGDL